MEFTETRTVLFEKYYLFVSKRVVLYKSNDRAWYRRYIGKEFRVRSFINGQEFKEIFGKTNRSSDILASEYYLITNSVLEQVLAKDDCKTIY